MARSPHKSSKRSATPGKPDPKASKSRKSASRPKRAARRAAPRGKASRRPARSSKPQRKAPARSAGKASRKAKPARAAPSAQSSARKSAKRPSTSKPPSPKTKAAPTAARKAGLKVVLFGAGGMVGSRIAKEALSRGHKVLAVQRNPGGLDLDGRHVMTVKGDATDAESVARLAKGSDAIVSAVSPRDPPGADTLRRAAKALLAGSRKSGVKRLVVVGGAGSLSVGPTQMLVDSPQFPEAYKPEAREHVAALNVYRTEGAGVEWTFISPAAMIFPGKRTGKYQAGSDDLLTGKDGQSQISAEDYAVALVDELERGAHKGRRMTVAWP